VGDALGLRAVVFAVALVVSLGGAGCGSDESNEGDTAPEVARPQDFPTATGKTLVQIRNEVGVSGPVLAPSVSEFEPGKNRFGFGLFDRARAQIAKAPAAVYVAPAGGGQALGPFTAKYESLEVKPQFHSQTVESDPDAAGSLYVADVDLPKAGRYDVMGVARLDDRLVAAMSAGPGLTVVKDSKVPEVGERPPRVSTPTKASVSGDLKKIDTRVPPSSMHEHDFADVLGKKPVVLLFATPALCQSRVCGPVVDIAEQVKAQEGEKAEFIHMEIYRNNVVEQGFRPQVARFRLPTEPWLFTFDRKGRVAARLEGAFSVRELEQAVAAATKR
jgi:hypothetical protein